MADFDQDLPGQYPSGIPVADAVDFIKNTNGKLFSVCFLKRTSNEERKMLCRTGVTSHLAGGEKKFKDSDKGLITVFDMSKQGYRSIPIDGLIWIKIKGEQVNVIHA